MTLQTPGAYREGPGPTQDERTLRPDHRRWPARWSRRQQAIAQEAALDGLYVIRTSEARFSSQDTVRHYKALMRVERMFRTLKGIDLRVRSIHHRLEETVRAHVLLCVLAYYVEWHMRQGWAPLLFDDEQLAEHRWTRDPVAPAHPSPSARRKKAARRIVDGLEVQRFKTLMAQLATRCRCHCRIDMPTPKDKTKDTGDSTVRYQRLTEPTPLQTKAFQLLGLNCSQ